MADQNKLKLIIGLSLIAVSFICAATALYFIGNANKSYQEKLGTLEVQMANLIAEQSQEALPISDARRVNRAPVNLEEYLSRAETIYGTAELKRKEGVLWLDKKAAQCVITLGRVNGLDTGSKLDIFEADKKIGEAIVDIPMDITAYVKLSDKTMDDFNNSYYRVVIVQD
ncbi:MAG: hypothetical protein WC676_01225 [Candidatus Omnitrophota bacterium]